jgi:hypothetical protein
VIESALVTYLNTVASITAIVGARIYPLEVPQQAAYPAITYERESTEHVRSMQGESGLARTSLAVTCWARSYDTAKQLADAVRLAIDGFQGTWGTTQVASHLLDETDFLTPVPGNQPQRLIGVQLDLAIWHGETVPA